MTLGEKIFTLRNQSKLSQGELAEKLNVSRQSISKWETGASVPELDKLIALSEVFGVTLDELAKGDAVPRRAPESPGVRTAGTKGLPHTKNSGAASVWDRAFMLRAGVAVGRRLLSDWWISFVLRRSLSVCETKCRTCDRVGHTDSDSDFAPYWTGIQPFFVLNPGFYAQGISINQILTVAFWVFAAFLTVAAVRRFRYKKKNRTESKTHK